MKPNRRAKNVKELIVQNRFKELFKLLESVADSEEDESYVHIFQSRYKKNEHDYHKGIIERSEYNIELNKIRNGVIEFEKEILNKSTSWNLGEAILVIVVIVSVVFFMFQPSSEAYSGQSSGTGIRYFEELEGKPSYHGEMIFSIPALMLVNDEYLITLEALSGSSGDSQATLELQVVNETFNRERNFSTPIIDSLVVSDTIDVEKLKKSLFDDYIISFEGTNVMPLGSQMEAELFVNDVAKFLITPIEKSRQLVTAETSNLWQWIVVPKGVVA